MTTKTIGTAIPSFKEDYKESVPVDFIATLYHEYIQSNLDNVVPSGFSLDAKGNFKGHLNIALQLVAEPTPGNWEDARKIFMTIALKGKIFIMDPDQQNRTLVILPKSFDLTSLKIFKGEDEQFLEQMLVQSLLGVQLE